MGLNMNDFIKTILTPTLRHGATALAGYLMAHGILDSVQGAGFTEAATGLVIGGVGYIWSIWKAKKNVAVLGSGMTG